MDNKEIYRQKVEAQLDLWRAEIEVMKAKAKLAGADVKLDMEEQANNLEAKLAWAILKDGAESIWGNLKQSLSEAKSKFDK
jgi:hypothetical protein